MGLIAKEKQVCINKMRIGQEMSNQENVRLALAEAQKEREDICSLTPLVNPKSSRMLNNKGLFFPPRTSFLTPASMQLRQRKKHSLLIPTVHKKESLARAKGEQLPCVHAAAEVAPHDAPRSEWPMPCLWLSSISTSDSPASCSSGVRRQSKEDPGTPA